MLTRLRRNDGVLLLLHLGISYISHIEGSTLHNPTTVDVLNSTEPYVSSADSKIPSTVHGQEETTAIPKLTTSKKPSNPSQEETTAIPKLTTSKKPSNTTFVEEPRRYSMIHIGIFIGLVLVVFIIVVIFVARIIWRKKKLYRLKISEDVRGSHQEKSSGQHGDYEKEKKDDESIQARLMKSHDPLMNQLKEKQKENISNRSKYGDPPPEV
ncbi:uncharacterized protein LOC130359821 isoform X2 [Hyla sarda]|uniref:uncharacterized protein LOC130359821 isoform X2 n=1 Tax=Hyla sarda TaxID=327740 RepID=UPI0024C37E90|nr:uncharacterized protein LOC130359821 isoform X2 [Hyla sarda]